MKFIHVKYIYLRLAFLHLVTYLFFRTLGSVPLKETVSFYFCIKYRATNWFSLNKVLLKLAKQYKQFIQYKLYRYSFHWFRELVTMYLNKDKMIPNIHTDSWNSGVSYTHTSQTQDVCF